MKRALIYARISVTAEESVSVERQIQSAQQYAEAMGWQVVGVHTDEGVSATYNKPEVRTGWRAVLDAAPQADVVLIWKIDRLARNVSDFMRAQWALQEHGAGLASVTEGLDLTTTIGQMVATNLAFFAQMEAEAISARVAAARQHLLRSGRAVGGTVVWGWQNVPNPEGAGYVLAQDPERIGWVHAAAERTLAGHSLYSTVQWLNEQRVPTPSWKGVPFAWKDWAYTSLERLLRHPVLAGMTPFNPGNQSKRRGDDVLRGEDGLPVVDPTLAIMEVGQWRAMVRMLDERDSAQTKPRAMRSETSALLSGLVFCADGKGKHDDDQPVRMWRATVQGREGYQCPTCFHAISNFEHAVIAEFLRQKGTWVRWTPVEEVAEGGAALLPEIEHRLSELAGLLDAAEDDEEVERLQAQQADLIRERRRRRGEAPVTTLRYEPAGLFAQDWAAAQDDVERRAVLADALHRVEVRRGRPGRRTEAQLLARLDFRWRDPQAVGLPEDRSLTG